jgi:hypothetical protein
MQRDPAGDFDHPCLAVRCAATSSVASAAREEMGEKHRGNTANTPALKAMPLTFMAIAPDLG